MRTKRVWLNIAAYGCLFLGMSGMAIGSESGGEIEDVVQAVEASTSLDAQATTASEATSVVDAAPAAVETPAVEDVAKSQVQTMVEVSDDQEPESAGELNVDELWSVTLTKLKEFTEVQNEYEQLRKDWQRAITIYRPQSNRIQDLAAKIQKASEERLEMEASCYATIDRAMAGLEEELAQLEESEGTDHPLVEVNVYKLRLFRIALDAFLRSYEMKDGGSLPTTVESWLAFFTPVSVQLPEQNDILGWQFHLLDKSIQDCAALYQQLDELLEERRPGSAEVKAVKQKILRAFEARLELETFIYKTLNSVQENNSDQLAALLKSGKKTTSSDVIALQEKMEQLDQAIEQMISIDEILSGEMDVPRKQKDWEAFFQFDPANPVNPLEEFSAMSPDIPDLTPGADRVDSETPTSEPTTSQAQHPTTSTGTGSKRPKKDGTSTSLPASVFPPDTVFDASLLKRDVLETTEEWQSRLSSYGAVRVGMGSIVLENYDVDKGLAELSLTYDDWTRPYFSGALTTSISLSRERLHAIIGTSEPYTLAHPMVATLSGTSEGDITFSDWTWITPDGKITLSLPTIKGTFTNSLGMQFNLIPSGTFTMGSPGYDTKRQHEVTLSRPYYMGVYEVTQGEWKRVMGTSISAQAQQGTYSKELRGEGDRYPMYYVSWDDCQKFVDKLNAQYKEELEQKLGPGWRYRLPSEAEWEYACRGGTTGSYGGTGDLDTMGWYIGNSGEKTHEVGGKKPNGYGLYDMHGNVVEWCNDWYGDYPSGSVTDPPGVSSGSDRVCRGGGWIDDAAYCRSASRSVSTPANRFISLGVRLSLSSQSK